MLVEVGCELLLPFECSVAQCTSVLPQILVNAFFMFFTRPWSAERASAVPTSFRL